MEIENPLTHERAALLSNSQLEEAISLCWRELNSRQHNAPSPQQMKLIESTILIIYSQTFQDIALLQSRSIDPATYTPFRANLIHVSQALRENDDYDDVQERMFQFARDWWVACSCRFGCHRRVDFKMSCQIFIDYSSMKKHQISQKIGSLLQNMKVEHDSKLKRQAFNYTIGGTRICKEFFVFIYSTTSKTIERLQNCIKEGKNFDYRWGGNNTIVESVHNDLNEYLKNKVKDWVLPNPGSQANQFYLPSNFNYKETYRTFCTDYKSMYSTNSDPLSWTSFYKYYTENFDALKKIKKKQTVKAREAYSEHRIRTALEDNKIVLSFDFAENILLLYHFHQPGIFFFKSKRKIELFGITNERSNEQLNYLIDECHRISKGLNMVISLLHHYLTTFVPQGTDLMLYADNCPAQNKNQIMLSYLCYLVRSVP